MTEEILDQKEETKEPKKLTPEQLQEVQEAISFPRVERITFRNQEINLRPLPLSYAKRAFKNLEAFRTSLVKPAFLSNKQENKVKDDLELAEELCKTFAILMEFYKIEIKDDDGNIPKDIEDVVTLQEIIPLLEAQLGIEEEQNFLFFPWRAMLVLNRFSKEFSMMNKIIVDQNQ
ncbi:hypothetical protein M0R19_04515 [Candidatus Pacearchaeota archaeon]|jgi:hypothetical protein|nr:hypothetical protein [Candidatus Pacearchaeota archaeon]